MDSVDDRHGSRIDEGVGGHADTGPAWTHLGNTLPARLQKAEVRPLLLRAPWTKASALCHHQRLPSGMRPSSMREISMRWFFWLCEILTCTQSGSLRMSIRFLRRLEGV